jgi:hypothetical protein
MRVALIADGPERIGTRQVLRSNARAASCRSPRGSRIYAKRAADHAHLKLFTNYYHALGIRRPDVIVPFGFLSMLVQGVIFAAADR